MRLMSCPVVGDRTGRATGGAHAMPRTFDRVLERFVYALQRTRAAPRARGPRAADRPRDDGHERMPVRRPVAHASAYASLAMRPALRHLALLAAGLLVLNLARTRRRGRA